MLIEKLTSLVTANSAHQRDQLNTSYTILARERDQLKTTNTILTRERDQLRTSNTNLTRERDDFKRMLNSKLKDCAGCIMKLVKPKIC